MSPRDERGATARHVRRLRRTHVLDRTCLSPPSASRMSSLRKRSMDASTSCFAASAATAAGAAAPPHRNVYASSISFCSCSDAMSSSHCSAPAAGATAMSCDFAAPGGSQSQA